MKKYIAALDQGTTSSRCILFDREQRIVAMAQEEFPQKKKKMLRKICNRALRL